MNTFNKFIQEQTNYYAFDNDNVLMFTYDFDNDLFLDVKLNMDETGYDVEAVYLSNAENESLELKLENVKFSKEIEEIIKNKIDEQF